MAVKNPTKTPTGSAQDSQNGAEMARAGENTTEEVKTAVKGNNEAVKETYIYIGPTVKAGALRNNAILTGTRGEIKEFLKEILSEIPQVEKLLIPLKRLAESKGKVRENGTLLNKYYNEIASLSYANKED